MADSPTFEDLKRLRLAREVNAELTLYVVTDDARPLWRAYRLLRQAGEPVPEAILREFDTLAAALAGAARKDFLGAMKLRRRRLRAAEARLALASRIALARRVFGLSARQARELIAREDGKSPEAIKRAHQRHTNPQPDKRATTRAHKKAPPKRPRTSVFDTGD